MTEIIIIDVLRGTHLMALALGLGLALYFDGVTLRTLHRPITADYVARFHEVHRAISIALGLLWASGLMLVYLRTGFDPSAVTPKLWCKLAVVTLMLANSYLIAAIVLPTLDNLIGHALADLRARDSAILTQIGINSAFLWVAALALGSSAVLKVQGWDMLLPLMAQAYLTMTVGGQILVVALTRVVVMISIVD